jgi:leucyl aminopeptidase (aminopeptidase T)
MESNQQHQELLQKYAEAIVRVGLNLRAGQRLIITNATARGVPPAGRALVHAVTKAAYAAGARFVDVIWGMRRCFACARSTLHLIPLASIPNGMSMASWT